MTLLFADGMERRSPTGARKKWNVNETGYATGAARTGSYSSDATGSLARRQVRSTEEHTTFIVGFARSTSSLAVADDLCIFYSDGALTTHVTIAVNTDGSMTAYRGSSSGTALGSTAAGVVKATSTYQFIEIKVTLSDTVGVVAIQVDEINVLNLTGVDTKNAGTKTVLDSVGIREFEQIDDAYLCNGAGSVNNDFRGSRLIEMLQPSGNGNSSAMTNDAGNSTNNYSHVNDGSPSPTTTTYVDGINTGDKDTYTFGDSSQPTASAVDGIIVWAWAQKSDAGARGISAVARLAGTETQVAMLPNTPTDSGLVNSVFDWHYAVFETKPGGGAWTVADVNACEFGTIAT